MEFYSATGTDANQVSSQQNSTGQMTPILQSDLDRGTFVKLVAAIAKGSQLGVPIYSDLKDSNDDELPTDTQLQFELKQSGHEQSLKTSETIKSIAQWKELSLTEQRNTDHIDQVKVELQAPEVKGGGAVPFVRFRNIDTFQVSINSSAQIDWSNSQLYIDPTAIKGPFSRR
jgi:hypothetical protein